MAKRLKKLPKLRPFVKVSRSKVDNSSFYQSKEWRKTRKRYVNLNPICVHCELKGLITAVQEVDHIKPLRLGGAKFDFNNLQSLCKSCHARKSGKESHL